MYVDNGNFSTHSVFEKFGHFCKCQRHVLFHKEFDYEMQKTVNEMQKTVQTLDLKATINRIKKNIVIILLRTSSLLLFLFLRLSWWYSAKLLANLYLIIIKHTILWIRRSRNINYVLVQRRLWFQLVQHTLSSNFPSASPTCVNLYSLFCCFDSFTR